MDVTIITPLYNAGHLIKETADSVFSQTFENWEWIIVNDCSTDNSKQVLDELASKDERIRVINLEKNQGPINARNTALDMARGRFISFLDSDDLWMPRKLEKQVRFMQNRNCALSYTEYKKIHQNGKSLTGTKIKVPDKIAWPGILKSNCIMASSAMFDSKITGKIKQTYEAPLGKDDFLFFINIMKKHGPAMGLREDLARLRVWSHSITGNKIKAAKDQWYFYRKVMKLSVLRSLYTYLFYAIKGFVKYLQ
ncbi:MAG: glycosyltransferase family 2 protein [Spirochaetales bacterium]|nr:glycosyltransferase family 2 protein [Spirochaetales bacterium]